MTLHQMVDLETLGKSPGCVIMSIGAVRFDVDKADGVTTDPFLVNVGIQSCLDSGLFVDGSTIEWWFRQDKLAQARLFDPKPISLSKALGEFSQWCRRDLPIWCHGATFDLPLLTAAYRLCDMAEPWGYVQARDTRTLFDISPTPVIPAGVKHSALDDARAQAVRVQMAFEKLRKEAVGA